MQKIEDSLKDFLSNRKKKQGEYIETKAKLYPTERIFWFDSKYLKRDEQEKKYIETGGNLVYLGLNLGGREKYLLNGWLGNFTLRKEDGKLLVTDYFTPEPGPL